MDRGPHEVTGFYVGCPQSNVSGGPELCHQLVHALHLNGQPAWIFDPLAPADQLPAYPDAYRRYNVSAARGCDIAPGSTIVLPEVYPRCVDRFPNSRVIFWWMSVNNFLLEAPAARLSRIFGPDRVVKSWLKKLRGNVDLHLYQSEYARAFLEANHLEPRVRLSDHLADEFTQVALQQDQVPRQNLIAYNPRKGLVRTEAILEALRSSGGPLPEIVPISGMNRQQIVELLSRAKIYLDFGDHPGMDRLPREAVACGAGILVNRRGSAANSIDIPIDSQFKFDDQLPGYEQAVAEKILSILEDFDSYQPQFSEFRRSIATEPERFFTEVRSVFVAPEGRPVFNPGSS
jgi:hypothetical protein